MEEKYYGGGWTGRVLGADELRERHAQITEEVAELTNNPPTLERRAKLKALNAERELIKQAIEASERELTKQEIEASQWNSQVSELWDLVESNRRADWRVAGDSLAQMLNERRELRRIAALLDDLHAYRPAFIAILHSWEDREKGEAFRTLEDRIDKRLSLYAQVPRLVRSSNLGFNLVRLFSWFIRHDKIPLIEQTLFEFARKLIERDELDRLRRCKRTECRRWFFAGRRRDQCYCGDSCRDAAYEATPGRKQKNREKAKKYYWENFRARRPPGEYRPRALRPRNSRHVKEEKKNTTR